MQIEPDRPTGSQTGGRPKGTEMRSPERPPDRRPLTPRRLIAVLALAALAGVAVAFVPAPSPAAAAGGCRVPVDRNGNCPIEHDLPIPGITRPRQPGTTQPHDPSNPGTGTPDDGYYCEWHPYPDQEAWRARMPEAPPGSVFGEYHCFQDGNPLFGPFVPQFIAPNQGLGPAPPPPAPAVVAADGLLKVRDLLLKPTVATNPPDPAPSIVNMPTFVSVPNWQGSFRTSNCLQNVCVTLIADPQLTFAPGEPGADPVECEAGGTVFDRNGAEPRVQAAAPGACVHAYGARTGVTGRPDAWPAEVTVDWTVRWEGPGGTGDTFDPISLSTTFDRQVEENVSVITGYSD